MQLPSNMAFLTEHLNKLPQIKIAKTIIVLMLFYIVYLFAELTWKAVPSSHQPSVVPEASNIKRSKNQQGQFDIDRFISLNVFGAYQQSQEKEDIPEVQDAPETKLNLILAGVVASSDKNVAAAIIEQNGNQETYGVGDKIKGTRAQLSQVHADRVLIKQSGRMETLMLDGVNYSKQPQTVKPRTKPAKKEVINKQSPRQNKETVDLRDNLKLSKAVKNLKNDLVSNPSKISDYLKISPKREEGKVIGYRLMPGKEAEFFNTSGLKTGDVAVQMNGLDLSIPTESAQALKLLREANDIALLVNRNGELTEILFSIAQ